MWDLHGKMEQSATNNGLTVVQITDDGLHIQTLKDGFLSWKSPLLQPIEVITLRVRNHSPQATDAALLWHPQNAPEGKSLALYFTIPAGGKTQNVHISPAAIGDWDWTSDEIGFGFPAGTDITIEGIAWQHWPLPERVMEAWKTFWTFDEFRPYSINFLWGPQLAFDPITRAELFQHLPPLSWSVLRIIYPLFLLPILFGLLYVFTHDDRRKALRIAIIVFLTITAASWVILDLRSGTEIVTYAMNDVRSYAFKENNIGQDFRTHENFYALAHLALPLLMEEPRYVLLTQKEAPFYANLRYMTYPALPITSDKDTRGIPLWFVLKRADIRVDESGRLLEGTTVLAASGAIIQQLSKDSFLYRTQ